MRIRVGRTYLSSDYLATVTLTEATKQNPTVAPNKIEEAWNFVNGKKKKVAKPKSKPKAKKEPKVED